MSVALWTGLAVIVLVFAEAAPRDWEEVVGFAGALVAGWANVLGLWQASLLLIHEPAEPVPFRCGGGPVCHLPSTRGGGLRAPLGSWDNVGGFVDQAEREP